MGPGRALAAGPGAAGRGRVRRAGRRREDPATGRPTLFPSSPHPRGARSAPRLIQEGTIRQRAEGAVKHVVGLDSRRCRQKVPTAAATLVQRPVLAGDRERSGKGVGRARVAARQGRLDPRIDLCNQSGSWSTVLRPTSNLRAQNRSTGRRRPPVRPGSVRMSEQ